MCPFVYPLYPVLLNTHLLIFLSYTSLCNCDTNLAEEVTRRLCPPMDNVKQPPNRIDTTDRIRRLRENMHSIVAVQGPALDAYIITHYDEHMNDYVSDRDKRLQYVTGYTGTNGVAVVTKNKLLFWTDELHYKRADSELSCHWTLYKTHSNSRARAIAEWILSEFESGARVGIDRKLIPNTECEIMTRLFTRPARTIALVPMLGNLVDTIWSERPAEGNSTAYVWPEAYAGRTWRDKLNATRERLKALDVDLLVVTSLSEIAWLLNIRGFDLPYGPFLRAYVVVTKDQLHLYTALKKLSVEVQNHLYTNSCVSAYCTRVHEYEDIWSDLKKYSQQWRKILIPSMTHLSGGANRRIHLEVNIAKRSVQPSPLIAMMAEKNEKEKEGMKRAYARDAIILSNFSAFIQSEMDKMQESWDELAFANLTEQFRNDNDENFRGVSYPTTVATGSNTAILMYTPSNATNKLVEKNSLMLIDSGAHYWDGTTATARTFLAASSVVPSKALPSVFIEIYTRILSGLLNIATLSFPPDLTTSQLDMVARTALWEVGLDFPHSSGHGIGAFSNVFESPVDMNYRNVDNTTLKAGYFVLAETGYYKEDQFGMKLSCAFEVTYKNDSSGFLSFEPVTLFPFEHTLINYTMLSIRQKMWLNEYNERIRAIVGDELRRRQLNNAYNWVYDRTKEIPLEDDLEDNGGTSLDYRSNLTFIVTVLFILRFILNM